jgi:hypothetical protein
MISNEDWRKQEPLEEVTCSSTRCGSNLHCFRRIRPRPGQTYRNGICYQCGANLIDWERLDKKDLNDVEYTFNSLKYEMIRHHFWHTGIDEKAMKKARKMGIEKIKNRVQKRLETYLKPSSKNIFRDGMQTPNFGDIIFYAQHATSSCCRKCVEEWYGIDRNRPLTDDEMRYFIELIMLYIRFRLPDLTEIGEKVV